MLLDHMYIAALVTRIQNNDSNAFAELYALTYQKEYNFACNYLKDPVLAQDALQETYIRAYKNIARLKEARLFVSWLHSINFRVCYTMLEKKKNTLENLGMNLTIISLIPTLPTIRNSRRSSRMSFQRCRAFLRSYLPKNGRRSPCAILTR